MGVTNIGSTKSYIKEVKLISTTSYIKKVKLISTTSYIKEVKLISLDLKVFHRLIDNVQQTIHYRGVTVRAIVPVQNYTCGFLKSLILYTP